jgi:hypothetical protein
MKALFSEPTSIDPCPRCLRWLEDFLTISPEVILPLPKYPPLARDGMGPCCRDCEAADLLIAMKIVRNFRMARLSIATTRQEQLRAPDIQFGLVEFGIVRPNQEGDLERHIQWIESCFDAGKLGNVPRW